MSKAIFTLMVIAALAVTIVSWVYYKEGKNKRKKDDQ